MGVVGKHVDTTILVDLVNATLTSVDAATKPAGDQVWAVVTNVLTKGVEFVCQGYLVISVDEAKRLKLIASNVLCSS